MAKKVIILTGPGGAGKTTIAKLLVRNHDFVLLDGDKEDAEFFPEGKHWLPENLAKLHKSHNKIFKKAKEKFNKGESVVVDYIIFGHYLEFIAKFKKEFGDSLVIKVLLPSEAECIRRDKTRKCWTIGIDRIQAVRKEFVDMKDELGKENFIDTSNQTIEETLRKIMN